MKINKKALSCIINEELTALLAEAGDKYTTYSHNVGDSSGRAVQTRGMHPPEPSLPPVAPQQATKVSHSFPAIARFYDLGMSMTAGWRPESMNFSTHFNALNKCLAEYTEKAKGDLPYDYLLNKYFNEVTEILILMQRAEPAKFGGDDEASLVNFRDKYHSKMYKYIEHKKEQS